MSNPVHPFSLTNGTGDIRFTLPGSNQEWTTRIQRPGEGQANNNPSTNTPVERQASRRPQHDMLPQQHGQFVQQPQHGRRPSPTRGSTTYRDNGHHGHGHGHHGQGHHQFNAPPQYVMAAPEGHMPPGRQMAPPGHQMAPSGLPRGPLRGLPRHVIDNADSDLVEAMFGPVKRPKWKSTMAADIEALGLNTPEHQRRGQEMTPLGVPRHVIDNADSDTMEAFFGPPRRPKWKSTMAADIEALNRSRRHR
ncbi:hypothetical protein ACHAPM_010826 [Fusarium culmorum]